MGSLPANDEAFRGLPLVAVGPWCPEVEAAVAALCNRERLHLAAVLANAARKARNRGDATGAGAVFAESGPAVAVMAGRVGRSTSLRGRRGRATGLTPPG